VSEPRTSGRPATLVALAAFLLLEAAALAIAAVVLILELLTQRPDSALTAVALIVLVALGAVFLVVLALHALRGRYWIRGATITWQILQILVAISSFQGVFGRADIGWALLVPAVIVIVLLFTPGVRAATRRPDPEV
jgi:hypothetical protein